MKDLIFGSNNYWKLCSDHTYHNNLNINGKIFALIELLDHSEIEEVWIQFNLSDSIVYRLHCLVALSKYWFAQRNYKKVKELMDIFLFISESGQIFYKDGFLVNCEQEFIKTIFVVFSKVNKFILLNLLEQNSFKFESVISIIKLNLFDNLEHNQRNVLKSFFLNNMQKYQSKSEYFDIVFKYFENKQENIMLQELVDEALSIVIKSKLIINIFEYQINLENILKWLQYSSNKRNQKNKILIELRGITNSAFKEFKGQPFYFELEKQKIKDLLSQYSVFDSTLDILIDISSSMLSCYNYDENAQFLHLHETFTLAKFDSNSLRVSTLSSDAKSLNIRRANQILEIYCLIVSHVYMPFLKRRTDFDYTLHNLKIFDNDLNDLVLEAIHAYLNKRHFIFISTILPLIESKLRELLRDSGEADIQINDKGGYDFKVIGAFFRSAYVEKFLTRSQLFILSLILDDRAGLNLRNKLAHGLMKPHEFNSYYSDILILILIFISCLDFKNYDKDD